MRLSVIIPVYNAEHYVAEAIDSAIRAGALVQGDWELILVDNNSTDGSLDILREYNSRFPELIQLHHAPTQGAPAARNVGLAVARGEWIQFLDADDYLEEGKIAAQLELVRATSAAWVIGAYRNDWPDGSTDISIPDTDPFRGLVYDHRVGNTNANLYRRDALSRVGNWNEDTPAYDDPNLHFSLLRTGTEYIIDPVVRSSYRHHGGKDRVTNQDKAYQTQQAAELVVQVVSFLARERPVYFHTNATYFLGALLRRIRILATYDLNSADGLYRRYFAQHRDWACDRPYELVGRYTRLYPYLGFRNLERLRLILAGVISESLKRKLKS